MVALDPFASSQPQIAYGLPDVEYHAVDAASASRLNAMARSPAHCRARIDEPLDTDALLLGSATHSRILQPELFESRYMIGPQVDLRTKAGQAAWADAEILAQRSGRRLVRLKDPEQIEAMARAVASHPAGNALIRATEAIEASVFWVDERTGVRCKMRMDGWCPGLGGGTIVDLKTTIDAGPEEFGRSAYSLGYWRQAAMYMRGVRALGLPVRNFVLLAVEKQPPYAVACYRMTDELVEAGSLAIDLLLDQYATCVRDGVWPGYSEEIEDLRLPGWLRAKLEADGGMVLA